MSPAEQARKEVRRKVLAYLDAHAAAARLCDARAALPTGSSRAKVTSANARWSRAAEERDRLGEELGYPLVSELRVVLTRAEMIA